jgi:hypothetical protein
MIGSLKSIATIAVVGLSVLVVTTARAADACTIPASTPRTTAGTTCN